MGQQSTESLSVAGNNFILLQPCLAVRDFSRKMAERLLLINPAKGQHSAESAILFGHNKIGAVIELRLKTGSDGPKIKEACSWPVLHPEPLYFFKVSIGIDVEHDPLLVTHGNVENTAAPTEKVLRKSLNDLRVICLTAENIQVGGVCLVGKMPGYQ